MGLFERGDSLKISTSRWGLREGSLLEGGVITAFTVFHFAASTVL